MRKGIRVFPVVFLRRLGFVGITVCAIACHEVGTLESPADTSPESASMRIHGDRGSGTVSSSPAPRTVPSEDGRSSSSAAVEVIEHENGMVQFRVPGGFVAETQVSGTDSQGSNHCDEAGDPAAGYKIGCSSGIPAPDTHAASER